MNYNQVSYEYKCTICNQKMKKILEECLTEIYCDEFIDEKGNSHKHDNINYGYAIILCINDHKTKQEYIAACECGWNNSLKKED